MPSEKEWVRLLMPKLQKDVQNELPSRLPIQVSVSRKLPYTYEVLSYQDTEPVKSLPSRYETDILITETLDDDKWIPRIIVECKLNTVTTHDAITYSNKASTHKNVHPYLRYGILLGNRKHYPLPGRLIRHGAHFDFMASWKAFDPEPYEWNSLIKILSREVRASQNLEEALTTSRSPNRKHYYILHRRLQLE